MPRIKEMMRRILKVTFIVLAIAAIVAQFIRPDFTNPPVVAEETLAASTHVPADVQQIIARSCSDCHSNQTAYPWYAKVTPFNWFLADHIEQGRRELNFSVWNTYAKDKKIRKLEEICEQVSQSSMPLPSYLWFHRDATLSPSQAQVLCDWTKAESESLDR